MRISLFAPAVLLGSLLPSAGVAEDTESPIEIDPLNEKIAAAVAAGEKWVRDPSVIAAMVTDPWLTEDPDAEPGSQSREVVGTSEGDTGGGGKVVVVVKEVGLFDDATRQIDHRYEFELAEGRWKITAGKKRFLDARPPFPARAENRKQRQAGTLLCRNSTGGELAEQAENHGIADFSQLVSDALEGDADSLLKVLKFGKVADGAAAEIYAELAFGLSCVFEGTTFQRFLHVLLEEDERKAVQEYIDYITSDVAPE